MSHDSFSPSKMHIYLRSQCLMLTFRYLLSSSFSVQSLVVPTGRMVFLLTQICNSPRVLYLVNQFTNLERVCTATGQKPCWFCLLWRVTMTFALSALLLRHLPNCIRHGFQRPITLPTLMTLLNDRVVVRAQPFPFCVTVPIGYRIWALAAIGSAEQNGSGLWD